MNLGADLRDGEFTMLLRSQAAALRKFAAEDGIDQEHVASLAVMTGRGYRPPTTPEGWRVVYDSIKEILDDV